jgi:hypothetical protein
MKGLNFIDCILMMTKIMVETCSYTAKMNSTLIKCCVDGYNFNNVRSEVFTAITCAEIF